MLTKKSALYQYNASTHMSTVAMAATHECEFELVKHQPYSSNLALSTTTFPEDKKEAR